MKKTILLVIALVLVFSFNLIAGETDEAESVIDGCGLRYTPEELLFFMGIIEDQLVEGNEIILLMDDYTPDDIKCLTRIRNCLDNCENWICKGLCWLICILPDIPDGDNHTTY